MEAVRVLARTAQCTCAICRIGRARPVERAEAGTVEALMERRSWERAMGGAAEAA